ncbi:hypothetical protein [Romboutsia sp.]|uniref:hypothetical protein n=1 Tax=Romboutsia sp. TaxID=1965302 RepID=UPI002BFE370F|nr:hypothetical protein [Romboutsia sp.]HSQ89046.1 hypothetical protein [Romboutsia sp.]
MRNIKLICYLYEYILKDSLILDDINSVKFDKNSEDNLNTLLQLNLNILSDLETLRKYKLDVYSLNLLQGLIYSYFNFVSSIQYFFPIRYNKSSTHNKDINIKSVSKAKDYNNIRFFNLPNNNLLDTYPQDVSIDYIREISINAINIFFNYSLINNKIIDEYYEVFFESNPNNKFYQYFFKTPDKIFKIRILDNTGKIIYIYQNHQNNINISPTLNKEDSKKLVDTYLQEKFGDEFENLFYDKDYVNTYTYNNVIEGYKFKYNYKDDLGKINFNKGFYITINTLSLIVQEISLL